MSQGQSDSLYTCPMHSEVQQPCLGTFPKCSMQLEKILQFEAITQLGSLNKQVLLRYATVKLNMVDTGSAIQVQEYIDFGKPPNHSVSAGFGARI